MQEILREKEKDNESERDMRREKANKTVKEQNKKKSQIQTHSKTKEQERKNVYKDTRSKKTVNNLALSYFFDTFLIGACLYRLLIA